MAIAPVDYDPFADAPAAQASGTITPVDHDPFASEPHGFLDTAKDVAQSGLTGLAKGVAHIPSLYGDVRDMASNITQQGAAWALEYTGQLPPGKTAADILADVNKPAPSETNADQSALGQVARAVDNFAAPNSAQVDQVVQSAAGAYHQPQTEAGRYADTIGQFVPAAALGGGLRSDLASYLESRQKRQGRRRRELHGSPRRALLRPCLLGAQHPSRRDRQSSKGCWPLPPAA